MAQHVILNHPDVTLASAGGHDADADWAPLTKLACFLACALGSWVLVLTPFFLFG